jgi:hypothetical protein
MAVGATEILTALQHIVQALNAQTQTWAKSLLNVISSNATSATGGSASALPALPAGYFTILDPKSGNPVKVPYYNV